MYCRLLILTLLLTGQDAAHAGRIFGGNVATPHSRPYMVLVERKMDWTAEKSKYCGGFLLSKDFVMTAAHCQANVFNVHLGLHNFEEPQNTQIIPVKQLFIRDDYDPETLQNDLLLLKLSSEAVITNNVKPIALAGPEDAPPVSCSVSGWGRSDKFPTNLTPVLMEVNVTLTSEDMCKNELFYCCKGKNGSGKGDSGGPLVCENEKVYGVVSYSLMISQEPVAHYFVKIPKYKAWIDSIINNQ